jgi:hypothetical protein
MKITDPILRQLIVKKNVIRPTRDNVLFTKTLQDIASDIRPESYASQAPS